MTDPITLTERDLWIASAGNLLWGIARMAPDPLLPGIEHVREHLRADGNAARLIAWLDAEIAARKGG